MRYAVISDIHANLEALTTVLAHIERAGVDTIVCLGDIVGYHADPNECVALIRAQAQNCVAGNHDRAAAGILRPVHFGHIGREAIFWTRGVLHEENRRFLAALPIARVIDNHFLTVHAALHPRPNERLHLSTRDRVQASMAALVSGGFASRLCFFGHTHRAVVYEYRNATLSEHPAGQVRLSEDAYYMINPGSVGQPRDGTTTASYAIFDATTALVEFVRVPFDTDACRRKALAAGLLSPPPRRRAWLYRAADGTESALSAVNGIARRLASLALLPSLRRRQKGLLGPSMRASVHKA
jgi:predicted phosphodiesterase